VISPVEIVIARECGNPVFRGLEMNGEASAYRIGPVNPADPVVVDA
jgi:hypothetical protein